MIIKVDDRIVSLIDLGYNITKGSQGTVVKVDQGANIFYATYDDLPAQLVSYTMDKLGIQFSLINSTSYIPKVGDRLKLRQEYNGIPAGSLGTVVSVMDCAFTFVPDMHKLTTIYFGFEHIDEWFHANDPVAVSTPLNCHCDFRNLLMLGCKCGGV